MSTVAPLLHSPATSPEALFEEVREVALKVGAYISPKYLYTTSDTLGSQDDILFAVEILVAEVNKRAPRTRMFWGLVLADVYARYPREEMMGNRLPCYCWQTVDDIEDRVYGRGGCVAKGPARLESELETGRHKLILEKQAGTYTSLWRFSKREGRYLRVW